MAICLYISKISSGILILLYIYLLQISSGILLVYVFFTDWLRQSISTFIADQLGQSVIIFMGD